MLLWHFNTENIYMMLRPNLKIFMGWELWTYWNKTQNIINLVMKIKPIEHVE